MNNNEAKEKILPCIWKSVLESFSCPHFYPMQWDYPAALYPLNNSTLVSDNQTNSSTRLSPVACYKKGRIPLIPLQHRYAFYQ